MTGQIDLAGSFTLPGTTKLRELTMSRNRYMVALVMITFFVISLLTNIVGRSSPILSIAFM
jgi:hypothetical protein